MLWELTRQPLMFATISAELGIPGRYSSITRSFTATDLSFKGLFFWVSPKTPTVEVDLAADCVTNFEEKVLNALHEVHLFSESRHVIWDVWWIWWLCRKLHWDTLVKVIVDIFRCCTLYSWINLKNSDVCTIPMGSVIQNPTTGTRISPVIYLKTIKGQKSCPLMFKQQ